MDPSLEISDAPQAAVPQDISARLLEDTPYVRSASAVPVEARLSAPEAKPSTAGSDHKSAQGETGIDRLKLVESVEALKRSGKDTDYVEKLLHEFANHDKDGDQKIDKGEAAEFFRQTFWKDSQDFQVLTDEQFAQHLSKLAGRVDGFECANLGTTHSCQIAKDLLINTEREMKVSSEARYQSISNRDGYVTREEFFRGAKEGMENVVRNRLDQGVQPDVLKDLNAAVHLFANESGYHFISDEFRAAMKAAEAQPQKFDSNKDGLADTRGIVTHLIKQGRPEPFTVDRGSLLWMKEVLMVQTPNPESYFIEGLEYRLETYDLDRDGKVSKEEANRYFKANLWQGLDRAPVDRSQVDWAWESADSFWLCDIGANDSADLARATMAGVRENFHKYNRPYQVEEGIYPKTYLEADEYKEALRSELTTALLDRMNNGISHSTLKDYADLSENFKTHFQVEEPAFNRLHSALRKAALAPELVDKNHDGKISADELWAYAS